MRKCNLQMFAEQIRKGSEYFRTQLSLTSAGMHVQTEPTYVPYYMTSRYE